MVSGKKLVMIFLGKEQQIMARVGVIDGIPVFSTVQEALAWAAQNGLSGYHRHSYGYMGGTSHSQAVNSNKPTITQSQPNTSTSSSVSSSSGSSGGGSGY